MSGIDIPDQDGGGRSWINTLCYAAAGATVAAFCKL